MTAAPALAAEFPAATEAQWRALVEKSLAGVPFERALVARTRDGFALPALAARDSSAETLAPARGAAPWGIAARVDHPEAEAANALALADLEGGADQLVLVGAGAASARGFGLPLFDPAVLARVLAGVEVDLIALRLEPGADALSDALALADHLVARRLVPADLDVDFGLPLETPWDEAVSFVREAIGRGFRGPFLAADGRAIHEAGGTDAQELAVLLAILAERMRILTDAGLSDTAARSAIGFTLVVDADQLGGMAKLRAFRRLLARFDRACGLVPAPTRLHVETAWRSLSRTDAYVNTLRATIAAFAAGTGGADSLCVLPFTQAVGLPDGAARRLARNTSLVLQSECHLHRMVDPAAGSGAIEALTDALAAESWRLFQGLDREARAAGGVRINFKIRRF